jgi:hypothetical protein
LFTSAFRTSLSPAPSAKAPFSQPPPAPPPPPLRVAMYPAPVDPVDPADPRTANRRPAASSILPPKGRCIFAFGFNSKKKSCRVPPRWSPSPRTPGAVCLCARALVFCCLYVMRTHRRQTHSTGTCVCVGARPIVRSNVKTTLFNSALIFGAASQTMMSKGLGFSPFRVYG